MGKAKVCLICHKYQLGREYLPLHAALESRFDLRRYFVDDGWPRSADEISNYREYDAIIWCVRFRELITKPPFDWKAYGGVRVMYDQDAYQNFSLLVGDRFLGAWPKVFQANKFDVLICTGKKTRDSLLEAGVNAVWVPKAYDQSRFYNKHDRRTGACYFGELYNARVIMLAHLKKRNVSITKFKCSFFELNDYLNKFQICLICNMVAVRKDRCSRLLSYLIPTYGKWLQPGPEVMLKNFEVAASGCVQFCDAIPEMEDLGFRDGETMVAYATFDELIQKIDWYMRSPEALQAISTQAAILCAQRHTWDHRAEVFADVIAGRRVE